MQALTDSSRLRRYLALKRALDVTFSVPAFLLFLPFGLLLALLVHIDDPRGGSPVLFQERLGKDMRVFRCIKLRTMKRDAPLVPTNGFYAMGKYVTRVGRFLRKSSLDELPQLWNILRGDMSFVGPRPLILAETAVHERRLQQGIYRIKPGLTGLAQVSGRDLVSDGDKVDLDDLYCRNLSLGLDLRIVLRTVTRVLRMENVSNGW